MYRLGVMRSSPWLEVVLLGPLNVRRAGWGGADGDRLNHGAWPDPL